MKGLFKSGSLWFCVLAVLILAGGVIASALSWGWLHPPAPTEVSNSETLRNVGLLIGGALAFVFAGWRASVAERQANAAQSQAETTHESLRHDRYQRGAEMLGSQLLPVRVAGISALRRLAADYPEEYHLQVMELFCAFARTPTGEQEDLTWETADLERISYSLSRYREDVQAVLTAIGARGEEGRALEEAADFILDLQGANLTHVFLQNADLSGANLRHAKLPAVYAIEVNLSGAALLGALLYRMAGDRINLSGANLAGANMVGMMAENTNFSNAVLYGADLTGAYLSGSNFSAATLGQNDLTTVQLEQADFSGVHISQTVALAQYQLDNMKWAPGNPPDLISGAIDVTTGKPLLLREGVPSVPHGPEAEAP